MKKQPRAIPVKTRRLTRAEAEKVGKKFSAKNRVAANVKRVTKATRIYTDREVAQFKISARTGTHVSKETLTQARMTVFHRKGGSKRGPGDTLEFKNLSKAQLFKLLKKYKKFPVILKASGESRTGGAVNANAKYDGHDLGDDWKSSDEWDAEEVYENFDAVLEDSGFEDIENFGLVVFK